jgi:hypothetical protein
MRRFVSPCFLLACLATSVDPLPALPGDAAAGLPEDWRQLTATIPLQEMTAFLDALDGQGGIDVSVVGTSTGGRPIHLVHVPAHPGESDAPTPARRVLFYAQQHGDEVAGKDALLYLLRDLARNPARLPVGVELWILPSLNPDGAVAGTRESGAGVDLNRDHMTLLQPETRALHEVVRRVRPHVAVDCHEFLRDPESWRSRGIEKWPQIAMDGMNNPLLAGELVRIAERWVDESAPTLAAAGHAYTRYWVGGFPTEDELRPSAPDIDSAMNAVATYGGLSFIIESARRGGAEGNRDLGARVDAYLALLWRFVDGGSQPDADVAAVERARNRPLPSHLPTNYLWVNVAGTTTAFPVRELGTGVTRHLATPNVMTHLALKRAVMAPLGYAIQPDAAPAFATLLDRHGIPYERLASPRAMTVEAATLLRVENEPDPVYSRYEGRQIVRLEPATAWEAPPDSLWVPLAGEGAVRAALLLEPTALYGLWQYPSFQALVGADGRLPLLRVSVLGGETRTAR